MNEVDRIKKEKMKKMMEKKNRKTKIDVVDEAFGEKVIEQSKSVPVVVDFWSPSCPPCLTLGPVLEELAEEYKGKFVLAKINVMQNQQTAQAHSISSIPAVKMFKNGKIVDEFTGAKPKPMVKNWLDKNLEE